MPLVALARLCGDRPAPAEGRRERWAVGEENVRFATRCADGEGKAPPRTLHHASRGQKNTCFSHFCFAAHAALCVWPPVPVSLKESPHKSSSTRAFVRCPEPRPPDVSGQDSDAEILEIADYWIHQGHSDTVTNQLAIQFLRYPILALRRTDSKL